MINSILNKMNLSAHDINQLDIPYSERRASFRNTILKLIEESALNVSLRGSWLYSDFHLDLYRDRTYSDLDLIANGGKTFNKAAIIDFFTEKLEKLLPMKVSVHPEDHFYSVSLNDSKIKNIFEYIIYCKNTRPFDGSASDYYKAKTLMLLAKTSNEDGIRYAQIAEKSKCNGMSNLYAIKLGVKESIDINALSRYLQERGDNILEEFYCNCILADPSDEYIEKIECLFLASASISSWLKQYIYSKYTFC